MGDEKNRARTAQIVFRVSESEKTLIEKRIALSGRDKQDYLIKSCLHQRLAVIGNRPCFLRLETELKGIRSELERMADATGVEKAGLYPVQFAIELIGSFVDGLVTEATEGEAEG